MASVTSLDKDLRSLRLSRYTPQAAAEVRDWIEEVLQEQLAPGDLLDALKDGVALCKLINLAVSPGVKYKQSSMPFVQMENISHFLRACQIPPLNLPPHDVFLTVDLYEGKDPAQVLQCIMSFSRRANAVQPSKFRRTIGPQVNKGSGLSPDVTGSSQRLTTPSRFRGASPNSSAQSTPANSSNVSSWSRKTDETSTAPAWNIHQYGYMGGADQGNQGVVFGGRRQITTAAPVVPSLAEKEKRRHEAEERALVEKQGAEQARQRQREAEEEQARLEEQRRWDEHTTRLREQERLQVEEEKKRWDEEKRLWEAEEQRRLNEEREAEEKFEQERQRRRSMADNRLNGQFLSQYQASQPSPVKVAPLPSAESQESQRVKELERELQLARERELKYQHEREDFKKKAEPPRPRPVPPKPSYDFSSLEQERRMLRTEWNKNQDEFSAPPTPPRPLPDPTQAQKSPQTSPRPLPDPVAYTNARENRVDRFLASNKPPVAPKPTSHRPADYSTTAEVDAENSRREAAQQQTKAGGWASKSLLEREMERERERQREWEDGQKETQEAAAKGLADPSQGSGPGGAWNVFQYGYMGGDNQSRGGPGLSAWGARRQIIGPRPPP
ncbi:calponin homology domain protein [Aspergillus ruber CBS 135680]|uniref:Calponin-homology (CH) domain-containing protein n=1 Tax=Aspergillus ruber (strain CBS 135680) TaxID=1388766 RepID=A0A017S9F9_ASPRC|nr:uncharacterized protein EURHEDRAFT_461683 [Aspergillus ruber CBS 135680]EYE92830.1 hypothetical protein EURHEDRAFT_461683 [Aspergillus ruber CBS 135680]